MFAVLSFIFSVKRKNKTVCVLFGNVACNIFYVKAFENNKAKCCWSFKFFILKCPNQISFETMF